VTVEYLESCEATIYAVKTPQLTMGQYPLGKWSCVEAELLDAAETYLPEWLGK
jgi:hypothetical protein